MSRKLAHKENTESIHYEFNAAAQKEPSPASGEGSLLAFLTELDHKWLLYLGIAAIIVRLAFLNHPSVVVFDEVHFGGFAQKYLQHDFFFDLHPPLARLLVTLSAWLGGWDASFSFYDIGADYLKPAVPYVMMRGFSAVAGALVVPIAYMTLRGLDVDTLTAVAMSTALIAENGLVTQSRLILLDAYLVLFTSLVPLFWVLFRRQRDRPFGEAWWVALLGLGVSMALAASCKWVGLFAVAAIGLYTIVDLWRLLGNVHVPLASLGRHLLARSLALIALPVAVYAATFWIHFSLLTRYNQTASGLSLEFQQTLKGGELPATMEPVFYGSQVRIRQYKLDGPYLHSHGHNYPDGSKQQQVTGYHHRDLNNLWIIRRPFEVNVTYQTDQPDEQSELMTLRHGDGLRLEHRSTGRFLHSHNVAPPLSNKEKQFEVSSYAHHPSKVSDLNDNWRIEIVDDAGNSITEDPAIEEDEIHLGSADRAKRPPILAVGTRFRLVHSLLGCKLHCRNKALPEWGYKQAEMTCGRETLRTNQIWIIEANEHPAADAAALAKVTMRRAGFWSKFWEANKRMWATNAGLSADHPFASRPGEWPLLARGVGFWNGNHVGKTEKQFRAAKEAEGKKADKAAAHAAKKQAAVAAAIAKAEKAAGKGSGTEDEEVEIPNVDAPLEEEAEEAPLEISDAEEHVEEEEQRERARLAQEYIKFKGQQIYLLGNPVVWWSATGAVVLYVLTVMATRLVKKRASVSARIPGVLALFDEHQGILGRHCDIMSGAGFCFIQWLWHWVPFFGMDRQLFLHHYLPALYFAFLLLAILMDAGLQVATMRLSPARGYRLRAILLLAYVMGALYVFWRLAPLGYGLRMSRGQCEALKWFSRWDFDCSSLVDPVTAAIVTGSSSK